MESIILSIVFLFHDYSIIICLVLFYLVNLSFPSLGFLVVLSFSILPTLWNLFLVTFISPSRHCYHWLFILGFFNLFIVLIYIYSPLKDCVLHKALNIVFLGGEREYKIVQNIKLTKHLKHYASNVALRLFRIFIILISLTFYPRHWMIVPNLFKHLQIPFTISNLELIANYLKSYSPKIETVFVTIIYFHVPF